MPGHHLPGRHLPGRHLPGWHLPGHLTPLVVPTWPPTLASTPSTSQLAYGLYAGLQPWHPALLFDPGVRRHCHHAADVTGYFFIDLVATVQWEIILTQRVLAFEDSNAADSNEATAAFSVLRLPRLLRLVRLFQKLDVFPRIKVAKLVFFFTLAAHWVGCVWFLVGYGQINLHKDKISASGSLAGLPEFVGFPTHVGACRAHPLPPPPPHPILINTAPPAERPAQAPHSSSPLPLPRRRKIRKPTSTMETLGCFAISGP